MDKKSKLLLIGLVIVIVLSVAATYYRTIIMNDFEVMVTESE